jgi:hypothetical protein
MKITEMSKQHLINRIAYFQRLLKQKPEPNVYIGDNDNSEQAVESENLINDEIERKIKNHIRYLKQVLVKR